jgi:hypothetical protein
MFTPMAYNKTRIMCDSVGGGWGGGHALGEWRMGGNGARERRREERKRGGGGGMLKAGPLVV